MIYFEQIPAGPISKYIDKFWYCQADNLANTTLTVPLLNHELIFNFSDYYSIARSAGTDFALKNAAAWVSGIQTSPVISKSAGKHEMLGVLFRPNGLKAFTKHYSSDFENNFVAPELIFDKDFKTLPEQIQHTKDVATKISLIQNYLLRNLEKEASPAYLDASLTLFELPADKRVSVKAVCNEISISNKSLIKSYQKHVGTTPVKYLQLHSINIALVRIAKQPKQSLTKLAHALNFYDQAHFIHLFKTTAGITPGQYADYVLGNNVEKASPNFIALEG
jgi:AraC-like DNA-binding protein